MLLPGAGPAPAGTTAASDVGEWSPVLNWPLVAVHAVLEPTGTVLVWDGFDNSPNSNRLWDPASGSFLPVPYARNLFCAGQTVLADGRTIVLGGHVTAFNGIRDTSLFNPATNQWTRVADMERVRWYPTSTTLPDGRVFVISGDSITQSGAQPITPLSIRSDTLPSIYDPRANTWTAMTSAARAVPLYPFIFVLPDGRLFDAGPEQTTRVLNVGSGTWTTVGTSPIDGHSAVMYRPGKILKTGKWADPDYPNLTVHNRAAVIDMNGASPAWREVAPMAFRRSYHNLVALPDGNVLVVGGGTDSSGVNLANGVHQAEIWNATTETWTTMAAEQISRLYHSTTVLLPDARILVAGGGALPGQATDQRNAEIFSPPYLFRGPRPTITSAPGTLRYGNTFSVATPDAASVASVALVRTAAVTHSIDMNQRYVPLTFTAGSGSLDVQAPANANIAPPGYYLLFIVDTNGVPSVAPFVRLPAAWEDAVPPSAPSNLTATGGVGSVSLMWGASLDDNGVTRYNVHRSTVPDFTPSTGNRIAQPTGTTYTDSGRPAGTSYYLVTAEDAAGNLSGPSNIAFATATADTTLPTVRITAPADGATVAGTVNVTADAADDTALGGVRFYADGAPIAAEDMTAPYSASWLSGSVPNGLHSLTAVGRDASNNTRTSDPVQVNVSNTAPTGLVAAYGFNEATGSTVNDASGNNNTGTINGATRTTAGQYGSALTFDGVNDSVAIPDASSLDVTRMTVEAQVRPVATGGNWRTVLFKETTGGMAYSLYAHDGTGPHTQVNVGGEKNARGTPALPLNTWTHVAGTYDGLNLRLYVNGVLVSTTTVTGSIPTTTGLLKIGGNAIWPEWFSGQIDEVRVYNRALSPAEIQTDINTPISTGPPPPQDTTAPTAPTGLSASTSLGTASLSWTGSTDNVGVKNYNVHRSTTANFTPTTANRIAQPTATSHVDSGLAAGTYYYRVTAEDTAGNVSASSNEVSAVVPAQPPPSGGLVAAFSFNSLQGSTLPDLSGNGNNGAVSGATLAAGKYGNALNFDGVNDIVNVADANSLDLTRMTLMAHVRPTALGTSWRTVLFKAQTSSFAYSLYGHDGVAADTQVNIGGERNARAPGALALNVWSHVAGTFDGTNLRLYVNGVLVTTTAVTGTIPVTTGQLTIGGNTIWPEWFAGQIDDVRVYNRALTQAEIQSDMNTALTP